MKAIPQTFFGMPAHCLFFIGVPVFYFLFILAYGPFGIEEFYSVGKDRFTLNMILTMLILFGVLVISRLLLYFLRERIRLNWSLYILWCAGEIVFAGMMYSILLGIGWKGEMTYFSVMTRCILCLAGITVFPYALITMAVRLWCFSHQDELSQPDDKSLVRFYDAEKRLKLIVSADALLYIKAEENYVHIVHQDGERVRDFTLRSSMRALEEMLSRKGLVRCHRSYFVNPARVKMVKKDAGGYALASLDREGVEPVPVSKRYYEALSALL